MERTRVIIADNEADPHGLAGDAHQFRLSGGGRGG